MSFGVSAVCFRVPLSRKQFCPLVMIFMIRFSSFVYFAHNILIPLRWMLVFADTFGNRCDGQHCGLKLATGKVKVFFYPPTHSWGRD